MGAAVLTLNSYTKTIIELKHRARLRQEEARAASHAPAYDEVVTGGALYSVGSLLQCPNGMVDTVWSVDGSMGVVGQEDDGEVPTLVLVGGCGPDGCEDCEREMDEMEEAMEREGTDSPC